MIIWGFKGREIIEARGSFLCPDCRAQANYELKRLGRYFTLYFIPLFQTKEIAKFIECKKCGSQFKEQLLARLPQSRVQKADQVNSVGPMYFPLAAMIKTHMDATLSLYGQRFLDDQLPKVLAFELGVMEYFYTSFFDNPSSESFTRFLLFYARFRFSDDSVARIWEKQFNNNLFVKERALGFESVADETNRDGIRRVGYFPGTKFKLAIAEPIRNKQRIEPTIGSEKVNRDKEGGGEEESWFSSISELVDSHMQATTLLLKGRLKTEHMRKGLMFELGVIEYEFGPLGDDEKDVSFFRFLLYHARKRYQNSEQVFQLWLKETGDQHHIRERKLGFDSANNWTNSDGTCNTSHYPGAYLMKAVGIEP